MFHPLAAGDERRIQHRIVAVFLEQIAALLENPGHAGAVLSLRLQIERFERLLEPFDLAAGFLEMRRERLAQLIVRRGLDDFRKRFQNLFLGVVDIAQFIFKQFVECVQLGHHFTSSTKFDVS